MRKLLPVILIVCSVVSMQAQTASHTGLFSTNTTVDANKVFNSELDSLTPAKFKSHPEYGINPFNAPCTDCMELVDRRTEGTRYYVTKNTKGTEFYLEQGYGPINIKDNAGNWRAIDYRLKPQETGVYAATQQHKPVTVDANLGFSSIKNGNDEFKFNRGLELIFIADNGQETSFGKANWGNHYVTDEGMVVVGAWPNFNIELKVFEGKIKTNFVLTQRPSQTNGKFIIRDNFELPQGYKFSGIAVGQPHIGAFEINDKKGVEAYHVGAPFAYDNSPTVRTNDLYYRLSGDGVVDIEIATTWLQSSETAYPVTIDPLVTSPAAIFAQASITGSGYNAACGVGGCPYNLAVTVPANCTVTDILTSFNYIATGGCFQNQGGFNILYGACQFSVPQCNLASPGTCSTPSASAFASLTGCIPAPQCATYNMNFGMNFYRCSSPGACDGTCIAPATAWTMTVQGRTVQASIAGSGPQLICQGSSSTISAFGQYGVSPYNISWSPGGMTGTTITVTPASTQLYTATITDACSQTATYTVQVNVTPIVNPGFTISPAAPCVGANVTINGLGAGANTNYDWTLPSSSQPAVNDLKNFTVTYASAGTYNVTLNYNTGGCFVPVVQQVTVSAPVTPTATIVSNPVMPLCGNAPPITFSISNTTNSGTAPLYSWYVNGSFGTNNPSFTASLNNGDVVWVTMQSNAACASPATVLSNNIAVVFSANVVPGVTITPSPSGNFCAGTNINFTANPTNGGANPSYQWMINGMNVGANSPTFSSNTLANGDIVTVLLTPSLVCVLPTSTISPNYVAQVVAAPTPSVVISSNPVLPICSGTSVTFTATPTNGGNNPVYQWKVNGSNVGIGGPTYTSSALNNGDIVTVVMTSNLLCATPAQVTSNAINVTVNPSSAPSVSITANPTGAICSGASVTFTATPTNGGTTPAYQWKVNGSNVGTNSPTFTSTTLINGNTVSVVMTSNAACASPLTATSNTINMVVNPNVVPSVTILANPAGAICAGTSVTFTATPTNGGGAPAYQWKVNGINVGTNSASFTSTTLAQGDVVTVNMTSNAACVSPATISSNSIAITVNPVLVPTVSITASPAGAICSGTSVTFTAVPTNGGATPAYQWKVNGVNTGTNSPTFSSSTLNSGDVVTVVLTSNATCASPLSATSNGIATVVNTTLVPSVTVAANPAGAICAGTNVTFTATPTNGGTLPAYQWKLNGANVGINANTFASNTLVTGDIITVVLTSNDGCANPLTGTSAPLAITVNANVIPTVAITANPAGAICAGASVTFTAVPTNGGVTPAYQWKVNGTNAGTNSATFTTSTLAQGDIVSVVLTSNAACVSPTTATSNTIAMTVNPILVPSVAITANPLGAICSGTNVTFTAVPTNGGATPAYQWKVNGINAGTNSATFSTTTLANNDVVTVVLTSNATCASPTTATSNTITIVVNTTLVPSVGLAANPSGPICAGSSVTFTASPSNGGTTPSYQWYLNGVPTGTNAATYTSTTLSNTDVVGVTMTSSSSCANPTSATSNNITMTVNPVQVPTVSITSNPVSPICAGTSVTYTATPTNGGVAPTYQWKVNGVNAGTNAATFTTSTLANNDVVTVVMTSNVACPSPAQVTSNSIAMVVNPILVPLVGITANPVGAICPGTSVTFTANPTNPGAGPIYQWTVNGLPAGGNSNTFTTTTLNNNDVVQLTLTSNAVCATPATVNSNSINITVNPIVAPSVGISANPSGVICAGTSVTFTAAPTNGGITPAYQWQVNGSNVGGNSATYTTTSLTNADVVTVIMTSNLACVNPTTATSNSVNMTVNPIVVPSVTIVDNPVGPVCQGTSITFTATPTNGGVTPAYQWKVNGANVGTNAATYTSNSSVNGDVVTVVMTSSDACPVPASIASNAITLSIIPTVIPTVNISASSPMPVCDAVPLTFTANVTGGGAGPTYQWSVGGVPLPGETNATLSAPAVNGASVTVDITSNAQCANPTSATSAALVVQALPFLTPSVTITSNPTGTICVGQTVTFTAVAVNGGTAPTYQWLVNSNSVGPNANTYITNTIVPNDVIELVLTSNYQCLNQPTANSNLITLQINPPITVTINPFASTICGNEWQTITATASGGDGGPYIYAWDSGESTAAIDVSPDATQSYTVSATDQCGTTPGTATTQITVSVTPVANFSFSPDTGITTLDDVFFTNLSTNSNWWTWYFTDGFIKDTTDNFPHNFANPGAVNATLIVTSVDGCSDTITYKFHVKEKAIYYVPNTFTPNADGKNEIFRVYTTNIDQKYELIIYSRSGIQVYNSETDAPLAGTGADIYWTGQMHNKGDLLPDGQYVYYLYIKDPYLSKKLWSKRGTILLIR